MRKRLIEAGVALLGVIVIALAVASATLWRADDVLVARGTGAASLLVTDPGVLELGGDPVTVRATVPAGARVVLAVGRDTDVTGWVGADAYQRVSGLSGWRSLRLSAPTAPTASPSASPEASAASTQTATPAASVPVAPAAGATATTAPGTAATPAADPSGSDMWVAQAGGTGSATLVWHAQEGRWSLLVAGVGADGSAVKPTLEMSWPRVVSAPWLAPGLVLGGLLLLAGVGSFGRDWWRARTGRDGWTSVETGALPQVVPAGPAAVLTRRQLRELEGRGGRPATGAVRAVTPPDGHPRVPDTAPAPREARGATDVPSVAPQLPSSTTPASRPAASDAGAGRRLPATAPAPTPAYGPGRRPLAPAPGPGPRPLVDTSEAPGRREPAPLPPRTQGPVRSVPSTPPASSTPPSWAASGPSPLTAEDAARHASHAHAATPQAGPERSPAPGGAAAAATAASSASGAAPWSAGPTVRSAPSWAAGGRRALRAGQAAPDGGSQTAGPAPHVEPSHVVPADHERRPTWAPAPVAGPPTTARPSQAPAPGPERPRADRQPTGGAPLPGRAGQPPRPGGWVPVPDAAGRPQPPARGAAPASPRPAAPSSSRPEAPGHRATGHPSWLPGSPQPGLPQHGSAQPGASRTGTARPGSPQPAAGWRPSPGSGPTWSGSGSAGPDERPRTQEDDAEETLAARADAWRRAWGLPTEPPADERGGENR